MVTEMISSSSAGSDPSLPLPSFSWWPGIFGIPWFAAVSLQSLPMSSRGHFPSVPLPLSSHLLTNIKTPVMLSEGPTLFQCDFILINYTFNYPISKYGHILRCWELGLPCVGGGGCLFVCFFGVFLFVCFETQFNL